MARPAVHPGKVLADELDSIGVSATELARQLDVPPNRISQIINGKRAITGDTALRLAHWFGTSAEYWMGLQAAHEIAAEASRHGKRIARLPTSASQLRDKLTGKTP
ncbi:MAG: addiction module antidote protein, HigA family [Hyphomicrobium sp.]|nr:addiction module antidote protein, HigA family [Hyphomicrobium sp.]